MPARSRCRGRPHHGVHGARPCGMRALWRLPWNAYAYAAGQRPVSYRIRR